MSFKDIIKKSILENYVNTTFSVKEVIYLLFVSLIVGIFIFFIYRLICNNGFYSKAFNISLILMPIITATIILAIQTSVVVSLGMVGALSIVRFRTALKNPLDLIFMFWSISMGIVVGAGLPLIAAIMSLIVATVLLVVNLVPMGSRKKLINITTQKGATEVIDFVKQYDPRVSIKSKSYNGKNTSILMVISSKCDNTLFDSLVENEDVVSISIVDQNEHQF